MEQDEDLSFEMIRDFVNLCRSGDYHRLPQVLLRMRNKYRGYKDEEILKIVAPAIRSMTAYLDDNVRG